jgi:hypothetical protein
MLNTVRSQAYSYSGCHDPASTTLVLNGGRNISIGNMMGLKPRSYCATRYVDMAGLLVFTLFLSWVVMPMGSVTKTIPMNLPVGS